MGILRNLELMLVTRITRAVDGKLYDWIEAVSQLLDGETGGPAAGLTVGAAFQLNQTSWFVDPVNGNDANDGSTAAKALKTDARRQILWGGSLQTVLRAATTVTYLSSPPSSDIVNYNVAYANGASLTILGTPTTTQANVALTAVTALNRGTQTPWDITGATLGAADVGQIVTINAGARLNNYAVVLKDLGAGKVRISPFGNLNISNAATTLNPFVQVTPVGPGDSVDVQTMPTLTIGSFIFRALTPTIFATTTNCVVIDSLKISGLSGSSVIRTNGTIFIEGANIFYRRCILQSVRLIGGGGHWVAGGAWSDTLHVQGVHAQNGGPFCVFMSVAGIQGSSGIFSVHPGASASFDGDCIWQDCGLFVYGFANVAQFSVFDEATADVAIQVFPGGILRARVFVNASLIYGDANAGVGMKVFAGGMCTYTTKPTINTLQGAGRQSLIGATNTDWAAVPSFNAANGAAIVVDQ